MTDITKLKFLRSMLDAEIECSRNGRMDSFMIRSGLLADLLDEIERLRADVARMREALEKAMIVLKVDSDMAKASDIPEWKEAAATRLMLARAALEADHG